MQDTAEGFGQPIRHLFQPLFAIVGRLPSPFDREAQVSIGNRRPLLARLCTSPWAPSFVQVADQVAWLQQGRIATYLLYSFVTLLVLLALTL